MLKITTEIFNLKELENQIKKLESYDSSGDKQFNKFLKDKVWETLQRVMNNKLIGGTTNDMAIEKYKASNHIVDEGNGFILYNDCTIAADTKNPSNYPNGEFSIALAFEYGVGIVGEGTYDKGTSKFTPWEYNVNKYNFGWKYPTENGENGYDTTYGYQGFEIYRTIVDEVNRNLNNWVKEYYGKVV